MAKAKPTYQSLIDTIDGILALAFQKGLMAGGGVTLGQINEICERTLVFEAEPVAAPPHETTIEKAARAIWEIDVKLMPGGRKEHWDVNRKYYMERARAAVYSVWPIHHLTDVTDRIVVPEEMEGILFEFQSSAADDTC